MNRILFQILLVFIVFIGLTNVPVYGVEGTAEVDQPPGENVHQRFITIDFDNVDIRVFIKYISELTGKNFVVDKSVQGNVTIVSPTKISEDEAYRVFESVLDVHGYTTVAAGSIIKILPSAEARSQNIDTQINAVTAAPEDRVVTQLIPLKYSSPEEMKKVLTPLVSKTSVMVAHTQSGILIITETLSNMQRLLAIIEAIDVEFFQEDMAVIPLKHATSEAVAKVLSSIYQQSGARKDAVAAASSIKVVPYERINSLVVVASTADIERIRDLAAKLDTEVERGEGNIHVFYLQNASAAELIKVLNVLPEATKSGSKDDASLQMPAISKDVKITADTETNSLVITASKEEYRVIEDVIKKLDIPRRMVYLEALIMEVDTDKAFEVGVQWIAGGIFDDATGRLVTGFSGNTNPSYNMIDGIDGTNPALPTGYSFGVLKQGIQIGGVTFPNIAAILRAYKNDSSIDIISTPQILTTDNKKAEISVGENIPYITSQNTTQAEQDYTQYEYKDVSTKLTITPHISLADTLRLEIKTEVIKLKAQDAADQYRPTTFKRTAETTVILNDTDTVVIGGIIGQESTSGEWSVPILGDIPVLGHLFKSRSRGSNMTNMFIFITPHIIRNPADLSSMTLKKEGEVGREVPQLHEKGRKVVNAEHSLALTEMGFEKLAKGNYQVAKEFFVKALDNDPKNPYALLNLGVVYESEKKPAEAVKMYQAVIATGTASVAPTSTDPSKQGMPLVQIARDNIEKLQHNGQRKVSPRLPDPTTGGTM
ncbi:type II secretion system secretin GspD [Desulfoprunum benzoelyticum]|uniref:General secretion pathway protein D n=1 Tax=Desulfoprunum benzoelyticum TaxID=1506996 RepID=A0A840V0W4_9BACT|nr:type II secretion system secretin GspD [Desulfoprunum benzoelyticum]MBB5347349.1 general secretion pathway protein D [Desulfoprunum benzoelyticum]MBM9530763.1 type II secretion system secretin GspD [Desulfoprunum benzoelyticum]